MAVLASLLLVAAGSVLGPALARRERVRYQWAGAIGEGVLREPIGVVVAGGRLYVTDAGADRLVVFDTAGAMVTAWGDTTLELHRPMHITRGPDGLLYVAEYLADRITVLDTSGRVVRRIGGTSGPRPGELDAPGGAVALGDTVFVADFYNHRVQVFEDGQARLVGRPGRAGAARLHYPTDVALDDSLLYVADAYNNRVQVFRRTGEYVRRWGGPLGLGLPGRLKGWFRVATGVTVVGGRVYVADFYNHRVQIFTREGRYLGRIADSLELPTDLAVAEDGALYVVAFGAKRVVRLRLSGP
jgi:DNA-binding beta-propeller fold protein YncE